MAAIDRVFSPQVRAKLRDALAFDRLKVLTACGPYPSRPSLVYKLKHYRARRAAWEHYLDCGEASGILDSDLERRLQSADDQPFREALAECAAAALLMGLGFALKPRPRGRQGKVLDLGASRDGISLQVEVKAPHGLQPPSEGVWCGNDAPTFRRALEAASKQFDRGPINVLFVVPSLAVSVGADRLQVVQALIGEHVITWSVDTRTGGPASDTRVDFRPEGRLMPRRTRGGLLAEPDHTRVSAVAILEGSMREWAPVDLPPQEQIKEALDRGDRSVLARALMLNLRPHPECKVWMEPLLHVIHNPYALTPLPESAFEAFPQLVVRGAGMVWTDGNPNDV